MTQVVAINIDQHESLPRIRSHAVSCTRRRSSRALGRAGYLWDAAEFVLQRFCKHFSYHATTCTMVSEPYIVRNVVSLCNLCVKRVMHLLAALLAKARCTITGETLIDRAHKLQTC